MKDVNEILKGETLLMNVKKVAGGKIQYQFAEIVRDPNRPIDAVGIFNASDDRFSPPKASRAWLTAEPGDAKRLLPKTASAIDKALAAEELEEIEIGILNPDINGQRLRLQVIETTEPTEWQEKNLERYNEDGEYAGPAKYSPSTGEFMFHNGKNIFRKVRVVVSETEPKHTFLEINGRSTDVFGKDLEQAQHIVAPQPQETVAVKAEESTEE